jgi:hypothetical protein
VQRACRRPSPSVAKVCCYDETPTDALKIATNSAWANGRNYTGIVEDNLNNDCCCILAGEPGT